MSELVERYIHHVGRYLPKRERGDIEVELKSLIYDQLEDRYPQNPTPEQVAVVLRELGSPRQMAASYQNEQYLVGAELYPYMMMVLRHGWVIVPSVVAFVSIFLEVVSGQRSPFDVLTSTLMAVVQTVFTFSGGWCCFLRLCSVRASGWMKVRAFLTRSYCQK